MELPFYKYCEYSVEQYQYDEELKKILEEKKLILNENFSMDSKGIMHYAIDMGIFNLEQAFLLLKNFFMHNN